MKKPRGFIALISAIIISALLLAIVASSSLGGFNSRFNLFESEMKERTMALADACVDHALLELANDLSYAGNATSTIGADTCYVGAITTAGSQKAFKTRAFKNNSYTYLAVTVDSSTLGVLSFEETAN